MISLRYCLVGFLIATMFGLTGCQSTNFMANQSHNDFGTVNSRNSAQSKRTLLIAQKFEEQGYTDKARSMYQSFSPFSPGSHDRYTQEAGRRLVAMNTPKQLPTLQDAPKQLEKLEPKKLQPASKKTIDTAIAKLDVKTQIKAKSKTPVPVLETVPEVQIEESKLFVAEVAQEFKLPETKEEQNKEKLETLLPKELVAAKARKFPVVVATGNVSLKSLDIEPLEKDNTLNLSSFEKPVETQLPLFPTASYEADSTESKNDSESVTALAETTSPESSTTELNQGQQWTDSQSLKQNPIAVALSSEAVSQLCPDANPELLQILQGLELAGERQQHCLIQLARKGKAALPAIPAIDQLLTSNDDKVIAHAYWAKSQIEGSTEETVLQLRKMLSSPDEEVVQTSLFFLGELAEKSTSAVPDLKQFLVNGNQGIQIQAAETILKITPNDRQATTTLTEILRHGDAKSQPLAAFALSIASATQYPEVITELTRALSNSNESVREAAALTLGGFGDQARPALPELLYLSNSPSGKPQPEAVQKAIQIALKCIKSH